MYPYVKDQPAPPPNNLRKKNKEKNKGGIENTTPKVCGLAVVCLLFGIMEGAQDLLSLLCSGAGGINYKRKNVIFVLKKGGRDPYSPPFVPLCLNKL